MRKLLLILLLLSATSMLQAQILWTEPAFPTQTDQVTLYYDATEGNGDVAGVIPLFAHTGVITSDGDGPNDWNYVIGEWGTADGNTLMTVEGGNIYSFNFGGQTLEDFYGVPDGVEIYDLAFVFRNTTGTLVGRAEDGSDIFFPLSDGSYSASFSAPTNNSIAIASDESVDFVAIASEDSDIIIEVDGSEVASASGVGSLEWTFSGYASGEYTVTLNADNGMDTVTDEVTVVVLPDTPNVASAPAGIQKGINYIDGETVVLMLYAPFKENVFVVGDFNNWEFSNDYLMNVTPDLSTYWIEISGLTPGEEYRFHYHIMPDNMRVADVYADKILDPWNDPWIEDEVYPNLLDFPSEFTSNIPVSVLQTNQPEYNWTDQDFERPPKERLVIYELLVRDWVEDRNLASVRDSLDYFERLGINAIQLMPVNEFEGNDSWGYNPMFYFAPDKYYGPEEVYKDFVNECHNRGIAVILDMALNHSFGQNPQVRMWFDPDAGQFGEPTAQNPYFNSQPTHDFNVGYDYNHEAGVVKDFTKRVLEYWIEEYHIDGYRMDLSKGFTQNNTLGNIGAWNAYDQSRIDIWNDYGSHVWSVDPDAYMILEHFADNPEETALANNGFMFWGNHNHDFNEATMGYASNFSWASYQERGWNDPHLVAFAESHDEERLMYKNLLFGNSNGNYNITNEDIALARMEMAHTFLLSIPGPKMLWQFGEVGYDYSINHCPDGTVNPDCRTAAKPVRWDYPEDPERQRLFRVTGAMAKLHTTEDAFSTTNFNLDVGGFGKRIHLYHPDMNVVVVGNFDVTGFEMVPGFPNTGTWYDFFTGESFQVNDLNAAFFYEAGEYHVYTDQPLETPDIEVGITEAVEPLSVDAWPVPFRDELNIDLSHFAGEQVSVSLFNLSGKLVETLYTGKVGNYKSRMSVQVSPVLADGMYSLQVVGENTVATSTVIKKK